MVGNQIVQMAIYMIAYTCIFRNQYKKCKSSCLEIHRQDYLPGHVDTL